MNVYQSSSSFEHLFITFLLFVSCDMKADAAKNGAIKRDVQLFELGTCVENALFQAGIYRHNPYYGERIIGGEKTDIEKYPYQVAVLVNNELICGGSIISENIVLTSAHCISNSSVNDMSVRVGSNNPTRGGVLHTISWNNIHPKFDEFFNFDVAVIRVTTPFQFGKSVQPIALVAPGTSLPVGATGVVTGWGETQELRSESSPNLHMLEIPILSDHDCLQAYGLYKTQTMFCAGDLEGKRDTCSGDSGGPFVIGETQVGVTSWGLGCARPNCPGIYTHLAQLRDWITEITGV